MKDVIGPKGSLSIESGLEEAGADSADVDLHTATTTLRHHHADVDARGVLRRSDDLIPSGDEPDHDELCRREQEWFLDAIDGRVDVDRHLAEVLDSMRIVLAADESIRTGRVIDL